MAESTSIHWHGILLPFNMDGVPGISFPGITTRGKRYSRGTTKARRKPTCSTRGWSRPSGTLRSASSTPTGGPGWTRDDYEDRWSGVIGLQGMAPYMFEIDASLYVSEDGDATAEFEAEYDLRITQRLVLQPRAELAFAAQDIPERDLGAGITDAVADLRLRYEIKREFAPYIGVRYRTLVGETDNNAEAAGADSEQVFFMAGILFAF